MTTTWRDIQINENDNDDRWGWATKPQLKQLRRELLGDARVARRNGSDGEVVSCEQEITEIENVLGIPLSFPRWSYLVE